jgi:hypothetical protein
MPKLDKKLQAILFAMLIFCIPLTSYAAKNIRGNIFIEMMLTMMEIMGFIDDDDDYYSQPYPSYNQFPLFTQPGLGNSWQSIPQSMAMQQMMGGGYPGMSGLNGFNAFGGGGQSSHGPVIPYLPGHSPNSRQVYKPHWIEGRWIANDGMIMEISQGQFKMFYRHSPQQQRTGLIRMKDKWLGIYEPSQQFARQYEFAYQDDKLALRDVHGNLMLFKRMTNWLIPLQNHQAITR